jgi:HAD superfamily hydrolase (TIGR01509 family)
MTRQTGDSLHSDILHRPKALLFDMDGTLTRPMLDFAKIKTEMGIGSRPILEAIAEMNPSAREGAEAILRRHEDEAARNSELNDGCRELLAWIAAKPIPTALITRNSRRSVEIVLHRHGLQFDTVISREDGRHKPHPDPLLLACEKFNVAIHDAWMIGDGLYDIEAGVAAGCRTIWLSHGKPKAFEAMPWRTVSGLIELTAVLRECL